MDSTLNHVPSGCQQRIIETKNNMLVMCNNYSKQKLAPIAFDSTNLSTIAGGGFLTLNTAKCLFVNTAQEERQGFRHQQFGIVPDPYIPNRYYIKVGGHYADNGNYSYLVHLDESGNTSEVAKITAFGQQLDIQEIVDIDEYYIYLLVKWDNTTNTGLFRVDKRTNAIVQCHYNGPDSKTMLTILHVDENYIYMYCRHRSDRILLYRYHKSGQSVTTVDITYTTYGNPSVVPDYDAFLCDDIFMYGTIACIYIPWRYSNNFGIKALRIDTSKDVTQLGINNSHWFTACTTGTQWQWNNRNNCAIHRMWIVDNYLYYIFYDEYYRVNDFTSSDKQGIHTFRINSTGTLSYVGYNQIDTKTQIISMTYSSDKKVMILGFPQSFRILKLNPNTHMYEICDREFNLYVSSVGFDEYDRIWIQRLDNSVEVFSLEDPESVTVQFECAAYVHYGEDISSYVSFTATTFLNTAAVGRYIFELQGTVKFAENGQQRIELQYEGDEMHIPIVVTGTEPLVCKAFYIKESD